MDDEQSRELVDRFARALAAGDENLLRSLFEEGVADDFVQEWPQSGERIRGKANVMAIHDSYPRQPSFSIRDIKGSGDTWVIEAILDHGKGRVHAVSILELRDGKVARQTDYWGDPFEAPQWRAQWVERM